MLLLPWLTTGCGLLGFGGSSKVVPPPPPERPISERPPNLSSLGLQPLPTPDQVTRAVEQGRLDPFSDPRPPSPPETAAGAASSSAGAAAGPGIKVAGRAAGTGAKTGIAGITAPPPLPLIRLTGVIQTGGRPEAIVVVGGNQSGSLSLGDRGGYETRLLPVGWRVESIDIAAGRLTLRHGSTSQAIRLS